MWQSPSNLSTDGDWRSGYVPSTCPAGRQIHSPLRLVSRPGPRPFYAFRPRCPASRSVTHWPAPTCRLCLLAAPAACPDKMLSLQRISFEAMAGPCQPGTSCTQCMCHLSQAMAVTHSSTADTSLCLAGFRTALSFPTQLGGAALSDAALARLQQCPPADGPCVPQANATLVSLCHPWPWRCTFLAGKRCRWLSHQQCRGELRSGLPAKQHVHRVHLQPPPVRYATPPCMLRSQQQSLRRALHLANWHPAPCSSLLPAFSLPLPCCQAGGTCCLKNSPGQDAQWASDGTQMYWKKPLGFTAEDPWFLQVGGRVLALYAACFA